jgi:hypothetical protein
VLPSYQVDLASGTRLIGGEMLGWSDLAADSSAGAASYVVSVVLRAATSARKVLLLGPRASHLLEEMPADVSVDVLVRGLRDARHLAALSGLRSEARTHCGGLDRLDTGDRYDVVVALDGPDVLLSPDSAGMGHVELLQGLATWLAPGGTLVATVENELDRGVGVTAETYGGHVLRPPCRDGRGQGGRRGHDRQAGTAGLPRGSVRRYERCRAGELRPSRPAPGRSPYRRGSRAERGFRSARGREPACA